MWNETKKIKDVFAWDRSFIFEYLPNAIQDFELWTEEEGQYMDSEYLGQWSGLKPISTLTEKCVVDDEISDENLHKLAQLIYAKYHRRWEQYKKYDQADYDVWDDIEDETHTIQEANEQKPSDWKTTSQGTDADNNTTTDFGRYGENSEDAVPYDTQTSKSNSKIETEQSGTYLTEHGLTETVHKQGSSKLRTGSEMMEFDLRFWRNWSFIEQIFRDVDSVLCADYYDSNIYFL